MHARLRSLRSAAFLSVFILTLLAGASSADPNPSAGCGETAPSSPGVSTYIPLPYATLSRGYRLHLPPGYDPDTPTPIVLSTHGYYSSGSINESFSGLSTHADANGYIAVYPESTSFNAGFYNGEWWGQVKSWNDQGCNASPGPEGPLCVDPQWEDYYPCPPECGSCNPCESCSCHDDVGFIEAVLDDLEAKLCLDRNRIYAMGYSNGGTFAHRLACELDDRLAAVVPQHGVLPRGYNCATDDRMPILIIGGTNDSIIPIDGTPSPSDGFVYSAMPDVAAGFAQAQGCDETPSPYPTAADGTDDLTCVQHDNCSNEAEVVFCQWNGDHDYPTGWGNDLFWNFFQDNPRPVPEPGQTLLWMIGLITLAGLNRLGYR